VQAADAERWKAFYEGKERVFDTPRLLAASIVHGFNR
jgi:hypothetical protein